MKWLEDVTKATQSLLTFGQVIEAAHLHGVDFFEIHPERLTSEAVSIHKARGGAWVVIHQGSQEVVRTREQLLEALGRMTRAGAS